MALVEASSNYVAAVQSPKATKQSILKKMTSELLGTYKAVNTAYYERKAMKTPVIKYVEKKIVIKQNSNISDYTIITKIGNGSYGHVFLAEHIETKQIVAIKVFKQGGYSKSACTEVFFLKLLEDNPHVVKMLDYFTFEEHRCIVFEKLSYSLYDLIKDTGFKGVSLKLTRKFAIQFASFLETMLPKGVIHCDLKPENILLRRSTNCEVSIIDFGIARLTDNQQKKNKFYIQSRYYRAPELIMCLDFGVMIDMWSLGCVLVELYTGIPIFAGANNKEQLQLISSILGPIPQHMIEKGKESHKYLKSITLCQESPMYFLDEVQKLTYAEVLSGKQTPKQKTLREILSVKDDFDEKFLDLITQMLMIDPMLRITPSDALKHPFFEVMTGDKRKNSEI